MSYIFPKHSIKTKKRVTSERKIKYRSSEHIVAIVNDNLQQRRGALVQSLDRCSSVVRLFCEQYLAQELK
jgi:hypothetical protein